jgi:hypothetical protein
MDVCRECCVLSWRGLCDELITRPEGSYLLLRVVVFDPDTSTIRRPGWALNLRAVGREGNIQRADIVR